MEWTNKNSKIIASVLTLLLVGALVGVIYFRGQNNDLTLDRNKTELKADSLLSVKLNLEREITQLSNDLSSQLTEAKDQNEVLEARAATTQKLLRTKEVLLHKFRTETNGLQASSEQLTTQIADLQNVRNELQSEMVQLKTDLGGLSTENTNLKSAIFQRDKAIEGLEHQLTAAKMNITADDFRVDVRKANKKVTAKAKKANELVVTFLLPDVLKSDTQEDIFMSITDLTNQSMNGIAMNQTIKAGKEEFQIPVHAQKKVDMNNARVMMTYQPTEKVASGVYKIKIYTKDRYIGTTEFTLRDSFWFF